MKNRFLFFLFTGLLAAPYISQAANNSFKQSARVKTMLAQIAGYQAYYMSLRSGYRIADKGLNTLHDLKGGTSDLHMTYYTSLQQVNPVIRNNSKANDCAGMQQQVISVFEAEISRQQRQQMLSPGEIAYIRSVYRNLLQKCRADIDELTDVLTPGKYQMTDNQRLDRVNHCYTAMQDKLAFAKSFTGHCRQLAYDRQKAKRDNQQLKELYGIH